MSESQIIQGIAQNNVKGWYKTMLGCGK